MQNDQQMTGVRGDYGSCADIPMTDDDRERADAMAAEMCANSACDIKALLLARRVLDLLPARQIDAHLSA